MAINPSLFAGQSIKDNTDTVIEMLPERPNLSAILPSAKVPGKLCGYYNAIGNYVELYVVTASGFQFIRVG